MLPRMLESLRLKRAAVGLMGLLAVGALGAEPQRGQAVEVQWLSAWYPATVVEVVAAGRWKIRYTGFGSEWDEVVGRERIRTLPPAGGPPNATPPTRTPTPPVPATTATPAANPTAPENTVLTAKGPVGLYFMTRFWFATSSLEQKVWYFTAAGQVYESPPGDFARESLVRRAKRHGAWSVEANKLTVKWSDGKVTAAAFEPDKAGDAFMWDMGIFTPIGRPDWSRVAGRFEGGGSVASSSGGAIGTSSLTLRQDGTFTWETGAAVRSNSERTVATAGAYGRPREGRWQGDGYEIALTFHDGTTRRYVAFPTPDPKRPGKTGMLFFDGSMHLLKSD